MRASAAREVRTMRLELVRSIRIRDRKVSRARVFTRTTTVRLLTATAAVVGVGALLGGALAPRGEAAATISAQLVKDINPGSGDSEPGGFTAFNGSLYFSADDGTHGYELWKSDGSPGGTQMVKDINPGSDSSPGWLTVFNGSLYFEATDGTNGDELWKSDGVVGGTTEMVKDINPSGDSNPQAFTVLNGNLYFRATDGTNGIELWKSDGVVGGTTERVKDINPGIGDSSPNYLTAIGNSLYFQATDGTNGYELWKSDGTESGTVRVKDINPGGNSSNPGCLTAFNGSLYFQADDGTNGIELWKSDGTESGTVMVKNINPGGAGNPNYLAAIGNSLYFQASDGTNGYELWKSDGVVGGTTKMVKDINPGGDSTPYSLTVAGGSLYFGATDGGHGYELWRSDGVVGGTTEMVKDINPGSGDSGPESLTAFGSSLFFTADDGTNGFELWRAGDFSPPETQIDSGPSGTIATSSASFTFSSDEAGTFQCSLDGAAMSTCSSPKALSGLADGAHTFQVRAIDSSGNVDASPASRSFTVDTTAPETQIASGPSGFVKTKSATFTFSSPEASAVFECKLDGAAWAACSSPKSYTGLSDGAHTFNVRAEDQVGNIDASPAKRSFTVDTHAPQTKIAKHPKKLVSTKKAMVKVTFTFASSEKGSHFSCKLDKKTWKSCSQRTTYKVKLGMHTFQVRATDRAGNTDRTPAKWVWKVKRG